MNKKENSFVYRRIVFASLCIGITLSFKYTSFIKFLLSYYTTQSNLVCLIAYFFFIIGDITGCNYQRKKWYPHLKGAISISIFLTFIIYLSTLLPNDFPMYAVSYTSQDIGKKFANFLVHGLSPLLVIGDYVFDEKGRLKKYDPFLWLIFPFLYLIFVYSGKGYFYAIGGSRKYAYFFLDYEQIGIKAVIIYIVGIAIGIIVMGYIFIFLDRKLATKNKRKKLDKKNP